MAFCGRPLRTLVLLNLALVGLTLEHTKQQQQGTIADKDQTLRIRSIAFHCIVQCHGCTPLKVSISGIFSCWFLFFKIPMIL